MFVNPNLEKHDLMVQIPYKNNHYKEHNYLPTQDTQDKI